MGRQRRMEKENKMKTLSTERCANIETLYIYKRKNVLYEQHEAGLLELSTLKRSIMIRYSDPCQFCPSISRQCSIMDLNGLGMYEGSLRALITCCQYIGYKMLQYGIMRALLCASLLVTSHLVQGINI